MMEISGLKKKLELNGGTHKQRKSLIEKWVGWAHVHYLVGISLTEDDHRGRIPLMDGRDTPF